MSQKLLLKKLMYRVHYRSSREADLIFKAFVEKKIDQLSGEEQEIFSALMQVDDLTLFQWIEEKVDCPYPQYHALLNKIKVFIQQLNSVQ
ncbi:MAG: succinate dehydrogenase assembly factor 2 [Candidatus Nucleicultricaceae bacterium]